VLAVILQKYILEMYDDDDDDDDDDGVKSSSVQGCLCNKFFLYYIYLMPDLVFRICCNGLCWPPHSAT
jgi:hypothetical protein